MDTVLIGVQGHVASIKKETGELSWKTHIAGGFGDAFVSLASDGTFIFAHTRGKLFCLDASSGELLWTNDLPGLGYGIASICAIPGTSDSQSLLKAQQKKSAGS
jgi:outer membrane protein assembly factor BamB